VSPAIVMRDAISVTDARFPKGLIMPWPSDMDLPFGMVWLRELVHTSGPGGEAIATWGDFTEEAKRVMREITV